MSMRFLKWLIVALIAAAIALALEHALRSDASAAISRPTIGTRVVVQRGKPDQPDQREINITGRPAGFLQPVNGVGVTGGGGIRSRHGAALEREG